MLPPLSFFKYIKEYWLKPVPRSHMVSPLHRTQPWTQAILNSGSVPAEMEDCENVRFKHDADI
jgi:hypothetical protein